MRIAIDARLNAYRQGGISQYTRQLITALADVAVDDQIVSFQHRDQLRPLAIAPNVIRRTALTPPHHRFEQWTLPFEVGLARPDVLHCPDFIAPVRRSCPAVVTIHDLAFMHYPEILDASAQAYYGQVLTNAPRADAIIAVSEATRQDIAQLLDIPIEQIDVIYEAAAPLYTRIELREGEARVLNSTPVVADTFMLFVSTLEPRKNLPTLLQALRICVDRQPDAGYRLVIVGRRGWRDEAIFQAVRDLKLADHVLFTGGVGQYDLRWLYNACRMYINPSLYEGFGLPLLEAMACGAACLAGATSSLPEIGGNAAIYVPPLDAEQWADEIMALWDDEERRAELGRLGVGRAQQFSWLRAARETLKVYRRAAQRIVPRAEIAPAQRHGQAVERPAGEAAAGILARMGAPNPGESRPCLRCGTDLVPGELLATVLSPMLANDWQPGSPRAWSCPRCAYVELVIDRPVVADTEHTPDPADQPAMPPIVPVTLDDGEQVPAPLASEVMVEPDATQLEIDTQPVEPIALEAAGETHPAPPGVAAAPPLAPILDVISEPIAEAVVGAPQADEAAAVNGEIDLPAEVLEGHDEGGVEADRTVGGHASVAGAPESQNGSAPRKPRSGRAQRRDKSVTRDPPAAQPSKPRQPRSKRK